MNFGGKKLRFGVIGMFLALFLLTNHTELLKLNELRRILMNEARTSNENVGNRKLVIYSGATDLKPSLYLKNFEYFLDHGVDCAAQDTALVVTEEVYGKYIERVKELDKKCKVHGNRVHLIVRENKCVDMESVRVVVYGNLVDVSSYDYVCVINSGISGPHHLQNRTWTSIFTSMLDDKVKMSGLSINCFGGTYPHVQSFMYCLDRTGMDIIRKSNSIFDCRAKANRGIEVNKVGIINRYEIGMSRQILDAGYGIKSLMQNKTVFVETAKECQGGGDIWGNPDGLKALHGGSFPSFSETVFFKTSKMIPPDVQKELRFKEEELRNSLFGFVN